MPLQLDIRRPRPIWLVLCALVCAGCASAPKPRKLGVTANIWPLFYRETEPEEGSRDAITEDGLKINTYLLWPLIHFETHADRSIYMFKPLLNVEVSHAGRFDQWQVLWPFFLWRSDSNPERKEFWFMPLISWRNEPSSRNRKPEKDFMFGPVLPLFYWGGGAGQGDRTGFVVAPLYGRYCNILAYERFDFVLWPLYTRRQRLGDTRYDLVWPIFSWTTGKRGGLRVWPLYVRKTYPGHYERNWALWPFIYWGKTALNTRHPVSHLGIFPLYRHTQSDVAYDRRYLSIIARTRWSDKTKERTWEFLWPFSYWDTKPQTKKRTQRFWPFYLYTKRPRLTYTAILYIPRRMGVATMPMIWWEDNREVPNNRRRTFSIFPLWFDTVVHKAHDAKAGYQRLFPLYGYERTVDGDKRFGLLSLPHFHDTLKQGFERNYSILGFVQYRRWADGYRTLRILGSLYRQDLGRGITDIEFNWLYRYRREGPDTYFHSYLLGLIKHGRKAGRPAWRLFYIPFGG